MAIYKLADWQTKTSAHQRDEGIRLLGQALDEYHKAAGKDNYRAVVLDFIVTTCVEFMRVNTHLRKDDVYAHVFLLQQSAARKFRTLGRFSQHLTDRAKLYAANVPRMEILEKWRQAEGTNPATGEMKPELAVWRKQGLVGIEAEMNLRGKYSGVNSAAEMLKLADDTRARAGLNVDYWLERADPLHRPWGHAGKMLFDEWMNSAADADFFSWIEREKDRLLKHADAQRDALTLVATDPARTDGERQEADAKVHAWDHAIDILKTDQGVKYLDETSRFRYRVIVRNGILQRRDPKALLERDAGGAWKDANSAYKLAYKEFSTRELKTVTMGEGWGIWVCSPPGDRRDPKKGAKFYSHSHRLDRFHHTSFLAGADVHAAGEWCVSQGKILLISNETGHYQAQPHELKRAIASLHAAGCQLGSTICQIWDRSRGGLRFVYCFANYFEGSVQDLFTRDRAIADVDPYVDDDPYRNEATQHVKNGTYWNHTSAPQRRRGAAMTTGTPTKPGGLGQTQSSKQGGITGGAARLFGAMATAPTFIPLVGKGKEKVK